jgi:hypothetical protein
MPLEMPQMKNFRSVLPVLGAASLVAVACGSFSDPGAKGAAGASGAVGTTGGSGGSGGTSSAGTGGTDVGSGGMGTGGVGGGGTSGSGSAVGGSSSGSAGTVGMAGTTTGTGGSAGMAGTAGRSMGSGGSGGMIGMAGTSTGMAGTSTGKGGGAGMAGGSGSAGMAGSAGSSGTPDTPCAILATAGNACAAAHSTVRVLYPNYTGPLYQVCKGSSAPGPNSCTSGMTKDIGSVGGYADGAAQDSFCSGGTCTISIIYDQSPNGNNLKPAPSGGAKTTPDNPANAADLKTTLNGHEAYGILIKPNMGYRGGCSGCEKPTAKGTATADQAETQYMVTSQKDLVDGCCFDYGNAETTSHDDGNGTMEAVYFGGGVVWGTGSPGGHDNGPWVMGDLENGLYAGWENNQDQNISTNKPLKFDFVTAAMVGDVASANGGKGRFALYGGNAASGNLTTMYDGVRPSKGGYVPMKKQGSIILGIGGDNSDGDGGRWYEGVMASGAASAETMGAVQANIVAAGYGK